MPERDHVLARRRLDRRLSADLRIAIRMVRAVERRHHHLIRDHRRVFPALCQLGEPTGTLAVNFRLGKIWMQHHIREQRQRRGKVLLEGPDRDSRGIHGRGGSEGRAQLRSLVGDLQGTPRRGALIEDSYGETR